jgi:predicted lactoylglutathione lyase
MQTINITAIQHIGIPVTDIINSQAFYERLGFAPTVRSL